MIGTGFPKPGHRKVESVEIFTLAWGASRILLLDAQESQSLQNFVMGYARAFGFFGCVPH